MPYWEDIEHGVKALHVSLSFTIFAFLDSQVFCQIEKEMFITNYVLCVASSRLAILIWSYDWTKNLQRKP